MKQLTDEVLQAIARGWCDPKNSAKVMDSDLAFAIHAEVMKALDTAQQAQPERAPLSEADINQILDPYQGVPEEDMDYYEFVRSVETYIKQGGQQ